MYTTPKREKNLSLSGSISSLSHFSPGLSPINNNPLISPIVFNEKKNQKLGLLPGIAENKSLQVIDCSFETSIDFIDEKRALFNYEEDKHAADLKIPGKRSYLQNSEDEKKERMLLLRLRQVDEANYNLSRVKDISHQKLIEEPKVQAYDQVTPCDYEGTPTVIQDAGIAELGILKFPENLKTFERSLTNNIEHSLLSASLLQDETKRELLSVNSLSIQTSTDSNDSCRSDRINNRSLVQLIQEKYGGLYISSNDQLSTKDQFENIEKSTHCAKTNALDISGRLLTPNMWRKKNDKVFEVRSDEEQKMDLSTKTRESIIASEIKTNDIKTNEYKIRNSAYFEGIPPHTPFITEDSNAVKFITSNSTPTANRNLPVGTFYALILDSFQNPVLVPVQSSSLKSQVALTDTGKKPESDATLLGPNGINSPFSLKLSNEYIKRPLEEDPDEVLYALCEAFYEPQNVLLNSTTKVFATNIKRHLLKASHCGKTFSPLNYGSPLVLLGDKSSKGPDTDILLSGSSSFILRKRSQASISSPIGDDFVKTNGSHFWREKLSKRPIHPTLNTPF